MSVPSTLVAVLTTVPIPTDRIHVAAVPGMDWLPMDILVKVHVYTLKMHVYLRFNDYDDYNL